MFKSLSIALLAYLATASAVEWQMARDVGDDSPHLEQRSETGIIHVEIPSWAYLVNDLPTEGSITSNPEASIGHYVKGIGRSADDPEVFKWSMKVQFFDPKKGKWDKMGKWTRVPGDPKTLVPPPDSHLVELRKPLNCTAEVVHNSKLDVRLTPKEPFFIEGLSKDHTVDAESAGPVNGETPTSSAAHTTATAGQRRATVKKSTFKCVQEK